MTNFNFNDPPPAYEENSNEYMPFLKMADKKVSLNKPDSLHHSNKRYLADFIPFYSKTKMEDWGYLLVRVNDWLRENYQMNVVKCEVNLKMIDSKDRIDVTNCYIFNISNYRRGFVNILRIHASFCETKRDYDQISMKTYFPELLNGDLYRLTNGNNLLNNPVTFQKIDDLVERVNSDITNASIKGQLINLHLFQFNLAGYVYEQKSIPLTDSLFYFEDSRSTKILLDCLRVFYKPSRNSIENRIELKTFTPSDKCDGMEHVLGLYTDWLNTSKVAIINSQFYQQYKTHSLTSITRCYHNQRLMRINSFYVFHWSTANYYSNNNNNIHFVICPRKFRGIYETYSSFMDLIQYYLQLYDCGIVDIETMSIPNALSWKSVRYETLIGCEIINSNNTQIFGVKLILSKDIVDAVSKSPQFSAPHPRISPTKIVFKNDCIIQ